METWPTILPAPTTDFGTKPKPCLIQTKMDGGNIRRRRRSISQTQEINCKWFMTDEQLAIFKSWFKYKIFDGADSFMISLPMGNGFKSQEVFFTDQAYSVGHKLVLYWQVSATLVSSEGAPLTEGELNTILQV